MDIIEDNSGVKTVRQDYGWGVFVDGIAYQDHNDVGYGGGADWWHYWENNAGSQNLWASSVTGAVGRLVANGDTDAWIYGSDDEPAGIDVVEVGQGINTATLYIEWSDGFTAEFNVHFGNDESDTLTGLELLSLVEEETELITVQTEYSWGISIDGMSYQGHSDPGYVDGENWWHYWNNDAGSRYPWGNASKGASGPHCCPMVTPMAGSTATQTNRFPAAKIPSWKVMVSMSSTPAISPPASLITPPRRRVATGSVEILSMIRIRP